MVLKSKNASMVRMTCEKRNPLIAGYCNLQVKAQKKLENVKEEGMATIEMLIILAIICGFGVLWMKFGAQIKEFFTKVFASVKNVSDTIQ